MPENHPSDLYQSALSFHRSGQLHLAKEYYSKHLQNVPDCPISRHHLSVILYDTHDYKAAYDLQAELVKEFPDNHGYLNNLGNTLVKLDMGDEAVAIFSKAIELNATICEYYVNRSNAHYLLNNLELALIDLNWAIPLGANAAAFANRANVLHSLNRNQEALLSINKAIEIEMGNYQFHFNKGNILCHCEDFINAINSYKYAIELNKSFSEAYLGLAKALRRLNRDDEVIQVLEALDEIQPNTNSILNLLGQAYLSNNLIDKAKTLFSRALNNDPSNEVLAYYLASVSNTDQPPKSPVKYVKDLFDEYAGNFDTHLLEHLQYKSPWELREQLCRYHPRKVESILDLGCGTGLVGSAFRGLYSKIDGVDVSIAMIEQCKATKLYSNLHNDEVENFLNENTNLYDLVTCADVLIYFGSLDSLFKSICRALKSRGYFSFTVEAAIQSDYQLKITKRYGHRISYIEHLCSITGFEIQEKMETVIRYEDNLPVKGFNLLIRKMV